jgi:IclR family transcriptional regulator, mhp operon transcriptional activator
MEHVGSRLEHHIADAVGGPRSVTDAEPEDGLASIAVPLRLERRVLGALNLVWLKKAYSIEHMLREHLRDLKAAAAEIVSALP